MSEHEFSFPQQIGERTGTPPSAPFGAEQAGAASDRLAAVERAVARLVDLLAERLPEQLAEDAGRQRDRLDELARELGSAFRELVGNVKALRVRVGEEVAASERRVAEALSAAQERLEVATTGVTDALRHRLAEQEASLGERLGEEATTIRQRLETDGTALRERLDRGATDVQERIDGAMSVLRQLVEELGAGFRADLEFLRTLPGQLGGGMAAIRDAVSEIAAAHAHIDERLSAISTTSAETILQERVDELGQDLGERLSEAAGTMRSEVQDALGKVRGELRSLGEGLAAVRADSERRAGELQESIRRVDTLAEAVETIGRRRGFQQVVESDQRRTAAQEALVERLSDAGGRLSERLVEVKSEIEGLRQAALDTQAGVLANEVRRRVAEELVTEEMVTALLERIQATFDQRFAELVTRVEARLEDVPKGRRRFRASKERS
jgi:ABC-type transporter Mla subunit MlaD